MNPNQKRSKQIFSSLTTAWLLMITLLFTASVVAQSSQVEGLVWALTASNKLVSFSTLAPTTITKTLTVTGLQSGETLQGIDFRPRTAQLVAVGSTSRIYTINLSTGAATQIGSAAFTPALSGAKFGVDFNPVPDRIRVVSDADQNLRLNPDTGGVAGTDTTLVYATGDANAAANPNIVGVGYTNNISGATTTTLYGIDSNLDILVRQGSAGGAPTSPNTGQLFTIGALGVNTTDQVGFDVADFNDAAFASLTTSGAAQSQLYSINLTTGAATVVGMIGAGELIRDLAIAPTFTTSAPQSSVTVVNAASYAADVVAPDSIAAAFGMFQTQDGQSAAPASLPLPSTLNGIKININGVDAPLFYVSNSQINFLVPVLTSLGLANVVVTNSNGTTRTGTVNITAAAPGLFSRSADGRGTAVALTTLDGLTYQNITNADGSERPVSPGTTAQPNYLILYGTGIKRAMAANPGDGNGVAEAVQVLFQGVPGNVTYAGFAPGFFGLDQINVVIPPEISGLGKINVRLLVNGQTTNTVTFTVSGSPAQVRTQPLTPGQITSGQLTVDDQITTAGDGSGRTYFFDAYSFTANAGTGIAVDVRAGLFDASVLLYKKESNGALTLLAADDDLGGLGDGNLDNTNSLLLTALSGGGDYVIFVTSADDNPNAVGAYTLRLTGNAIQPISYGTNLSAASISTTDLRTSAGDYLDVYWFAGVKGDTVRIKMASSNLDAFLLLNTNSGETLFSDDNSGGGLDAQISQPLPETGVYVVIATPYAPNQTGDYSLTLNRTVPALAQAEAINSDAIATRQRTVGSVGLEATRNKSDSQFERFALRRVIERH
jgi:uncharacterized protein (TIGR03437 family)